MSAPKYGIGQRIQAGMTIIGVIDHGNTRDAQYLVDGIAGPVDEDQIQIEEEESLEHTSDESDTEVADEAEQQPEVGA